MNDLVKSLAAITLLAMLGGLAVSVTSRVVHAPPPATAVQSVSVGAASHSGSAAGSGIKVHDSSSVKAAQ
jgi:hypothetical protein